jgi:hypothetical protein
MPIRYHERLQSTMAPERNSGRDGQSFSFKKGVFLSRVLPVSAEERPVHKVFLHHVEVSVCDSDFGSSGYDQCFLPLDGYAAP